MNKVFTFFRESYLARFLIPFGIIGIIFSVILLISVDHNKDYLRVDSVVSRAILAEEAYTDAEGDHHEATYKIFVKYTVDGNEYEQELGELPGYKEGDKIVIAYNPENPLQITQPVSYIVPLVIFVAGVVSLVTGIVSIIRVVKRHKTMKEQEKGWENE